MLGLVKKTAKNKPDKELIERLYNTAMDLARAPVFYTRFKVPDTVDGRYDLVCLMLSLFLFRIQQLSPETAQAVFDYAFKDIERGLREAGVGDLGVPKHMKKMLQAFYGRSANYYEALEQKDVASLTAVMMRNLYNNDMNAPAGSMAEWVQIAWQYLSQTPEEDFFGTPDTILQLLPAPAKE
jgi:hypothetical protein